MWLRRLRQKRQRKEQKSSSDDDESHWVQAAIAVAGLGMSLWDRHKKKKNEKKMASAMMDKKGDMAYANVGIGQSAMGELEMADEIKEVQTAQLTEEMTSELTQGMRKAHDSGASFSGSYRDENVVEDIGQSVWAGYKKGAEQIDQSTASSKMGAYSNAFASSSDLRKSMDEIEAQINSLG